MTDLPSCRLSQTAPFTPCGMECLDQFQSSKEELS